MDDLGVIDRFLNVFNLYIDSGFGLLGGEVAFLTATLVAIDLALVGVFWAMGGGSAEDVIGKLLRKTLYIGAFAFIINNFNALSTVIFRSFAGLGLIATGSGLTAGELLRPGRLAGIGVDAARPILDQLSDYAGFPEVFLNIDSVLVLFLAWLVVILSFFVLAVQLFVALIEFKLTTLAGFVLVPFALWNKTAFLAERVLGNVVSSGIKVLVLAVIVGIGTGIFGEFTAPVDDGAAIDHALAIMLASLALFGLGLFGPGIASGLVSGAPQLGAGAAAGTALAGAGVAAVGAGAVVGAARVGAAATGTAVRTGAAGYGAFKAGVAQSGSFGAASIAPGIAGVARASGQAIAGRFREMMARAPANSASAAAAPAAQSDSPAWAQRLRQNMQHGAMTTVHVARSSDHAGSGPSPKLSKDE
jgi:type IV secretion system protein TrbL